MTTSIKIFRLASPAKSFMRKNVALSLVLTLVASLLVAVFFLPNSANAVDVTDCTSMGQLRNGGFESPVAGTTVINASNSTYPATTDTNAQQNSTNSNATGVYGPIAGNGGVTYWNHLDASVDTSTTRSFALSGAANDARVYWYTTEATEQLELADFTTRHAGARFAELNATVRAALYQDIVTVPGVTIRWSLAHKGRDGSETMNVSIGKPTNSIATVRASTSRFNTGADSGNSTLTTNSNTRTTSAKAGLTIQSAYAAGSSTPTTSITDGTSAWRVWYGTYTETSTTTSATRFFFESVSPSGGSGNLLDSVTFSPVAACPISRTLDSISNTATIDVFDTAQGSFALVPTETGHTESITALTRLEGNGVATLNSGNRTFAFSPNGAGTTRYSYTINYSANGISSSSTGTISIVARDVFGNASCNPGSLETTTSTSAGVTTALITFKTPTQANTDNDSDHRSATCTWTVPDGVYAVDYLVVGGGGGGASGGGGGGGVVTSWATSLASNTGTERTAATNPLGVTPGEEIRVTVGGGGKPGWGGSSRCTYGGSTSNACTMPTRIPTAGADSSFGSISARGGGFGGGSGQAAGGDGGSGGGSRYDAQASSGAAASSAVIGANTFGNIGGGSTASGGYRAGGGGGGAGTATVTSTPPSNGNGGQGGLVRIINSNGGSSGNGVVVAGSTSGGGGHGGRGVASNIASFAGTYSEYGCGGGGGLNDNSNNIISGAGGTGGCSSAGTGSSWATFLTTRSNTMPASGNNCAGLGLASTECSGGRITSIQFNGTAVPTESFGGGGAGTDPEGDTAGSGGSGVVIVRYILTDTRCPNSSNNTAITGPIACPYPITITAGASVAVNYNLTYGDATNGYVSFPGNSTDTATVTSSIANGTDTVTVSYSNSNRLASFAVSNANTRLAGATYPMRYTINSGSNTSTSYILLRITDPSQATPVVVPVDPRATFVDLSGVKIGGTQMTQVCFTPQADNSNAGYGNFPKVETSTARSTETATLTASLGRLRLQGSSTNLQNAVEFVRVTKHPNDTFLLPGAASRKISVNVSNGTVGGNGSCVFGNESTIELKPIGIDQTIRRNVVQLRKRE